MGILKFEFTFKNGAFLHTTDIVPYRFQIDRRNSSIDAETLA